MVVAVALGPPLCPHPPSLACVGLYDDVGFPCGKPGASCGSCCGCGHVCSLCRDVGVCRSCLGYPVLVYAVCVAPPLPLCHCVAAHASTHRRGRCEAKAIIVDGWQLVCGNRARAGSSSTLSPGECMVAEVHALHWRARSAPCPPQYRIEPRVC